MEINNKLTLYQVGVKPTQEEINTFANGFFDAGYFGDRYKVVQADNPGRAINYYFQDRDIVNWLRSDEKRFVRAIPLRKWMTVKSFTDRNYIKKIADITDRNERAIEILERGLLRNMNREDYYTSEVWIEEGTDKEGTVREFYIIGMSIPE